MADDENTPSESGGGDSGGKKGGLLKDWKGLKGWQKAGVIIGGGALMVAIAMYYKQSQTPANAAPVGTAGSYAPTDYPGAGDQFPSVAPPPPGTTTGTGTTGTPPPAPAPKPKPKPAPSPGPKRQPWPKLVPVPVHHLPATPKRAPARGPMPKVSVAQWRPIAQKMGIKTNNQGKFVPRTGGYQRAN